MHPLCKGLRSSYIALKSVPGESMKASERIEIVLVGWLRDNEYEGALAYRRRVPQPSGHDEPSGDRDESPREARLSQ
jgi:hypothetical protein